MKLLKFDKKDDARQEQIDQCLQVIGIAVKRLLATYEQQTFYIADQLLGEKEISTIIKEVDRRYNMTTYEISEGYTHYKIRLKDKPNRIEIALKDAA